MLEIFWNEKRQTKYGVLCARINDSEFETKSSKKKLRTNQRQIELPKDIRRYLQDVVNRDLNYTVGSEYACADSTDFEIEALKNQLTELKKTVYEIKDNKGNLWS